MDLGNRYSRFISDTTAAMNKKFMVIDNLVSTCKSSSNKKDKIRNEFNFDRVLGFNFFTSISDFYYRENFHSDILSYILDPQTKKIGNKLYIDLFVDLLNEVQQFNKIKNFRKDVIVKREEGYIDILVYDKSQSIIIENKINGADDQPDQLPRYVDYVKNNINIEIVSIVYITLIPGKKPYFNYSKEYNKYKNEIKEKIIYLPAVSAGKIDLTQCFLKKCVNHTWNETAKVYLEQYLQLLKHLGGEEMMKEFSKKILIDIYSAEEKINTVMDIVEVWNNRKSFLGEIIQEFIKKKDSNFKDHDYPETIYKEVDDYVSVAFYKKDISFGFVYSPGKDKISPKIKDRLESLLTNKVFEKYSTAVESDDSWVWRNLAIDNTKKSIEDLSELVLTRLNKLKKLYLSNLSV